MSVVRTFDDRENDPHREKIIYTQEALDATARQAEERKPGACGPRTTIEEVLPEVIYEISSMDGVRKCIVHENGRPQSQPHVADDRARTRNPAR